MRTVFRTFQDLDRALDRLLEQNPHAGQIVGSFDLIAAFQVPIECFQQRLGSHAPHEADPVDVVGKRVVGKLIGITLCQLRCATSLQQRHGAPQRQLRMPGEQYR